MTIMMIVIFMPVVMNDQRDDTIVRFMVLQNAPHVPPKPHLIAKSKNSLLRLGRILM